MQSFYSTSLALLACLTTIAEGQASVYRGNACAVAQEAPFPQNTVCNVVGSVGPQAQKYHIDSMLSSRTSLCAQDCILNPDCVFAVQGKTSAVCDLYNATAPALGFKADAGAQTLGFARKCYFRPSTCSFKLQCPADDPNCGGKFLAATSDMSNAARYPTAFVPNNAGGTVFTVSNQRADITVSQGGKSYLGTIPSLDTYKDPSPVSFFAEQGVGSAGAAKMICIQNRDQIYNEPEELNLSCQTPEPSGYMKSSFFACPNQQLGRKTLRLARDPYYNGKDGCFDEKIAFKLVDFVAKH